MFSVIVSISIAVFLNEVIGTITESMNTIILAPSSNIVVIIHDNSIEVINDDLIDIKLRTYTGQVTTDNLICSSLYWKK